MHFVNLDGTAPPLEEWLGDLLTAVDEYRPALETKLHPAFKKTYVPKANWKVLVENFLEYYHLPAVHPALCDVSGVDEHQRRQGTGMYMCFATEPLNGESPKGSHRPHSLHGSQSPHGSHRPAPSRALFSRCFCALCVVQVHSFASPRNGARDEHGAEVYQVRKGRPLPTD